MIEMFLLGMVAGGIVVAGVATLIERVLHPSPATSAETLRRAIAAAENQWHRSLAGGFTHSAAAERRVLDDLYRALAKAERRERRHAPPPPEPETTFP